MKGGPTKDLWSLGMEGCPPATQVAIFLGKIMTFKNRGKK
jgi:hypothetical protein